MVLVRGWRDRKETDTWTEGEEATEQQDRVYLESTEGKGQLQTFSKLDFTQEAGKGKGFGEPAKPRQGVHRLTPQPPLLITLLQPTVQAKLLFPERCNRAATGFQGSEPGHYTRLALGRC